MADAIMKKFIKNQTDYAKTMKEKSLGEKLFSNNKYGSIE